VVIGGGAVATRLVGDLRLANPSCDFILAVSTKYGIKGHSKEERAIVLKRFADLKVQVVEELGRCRNVPQSIGAAIGCTLEFAHGTTLKCDVAIGGFSNGANTAFFPTDMLVGGKAGNPIETDAKLRSVKYPNIYAVAGTSSSVADKEISSMLAVTAQSDLIGQNHATVMMGPKYKDQLTDYQPNPFLQSPFDVPVGQGEGGWTLLVTRNEPFGRAGMFKACGFPCTLCLPCCWSRPFHFGMCCDALPHGSGVGEPPSQRMKEIANTVRFPPPDLSDAPPMQQMDQM